MQKGQLSLIVIVGLFLIITASLILFLNSPSNRQMIIPEQFRPVQTNIESCLDNTLEKAIIILGVQGGYIEVPADVESVTVRTVHIPFWYKPETKQTVQREAIENHISDYMRINAGACVDKLDLPGFTATRRSHPDVKVTIANERVIAQVGMPITVKSGDATLQMDEFGAKSELRVGAAIEQANSIVDQIAIDKSSINIMPILESPTQDVIYNATGRDKVIAMRDDSPRGTFVFAFAVRLGEPQGNREPIIERVAPILLDTGVSRTVKINANDPEGSRLSYDIISDFCSIDGNGMLTCLCEEPGVYHPTIRVADEQGGITYTTIEVIAR
jgi:hypothetical protein